ncbi:radical SAM protein [Caldanaerobacter subterraneus]|jgi:sulfatase maturation enzyme AslB (radical SAM superfamily)|uniref:Radical SAM core domain-containing protein n=1 Tax=Caldanaerobacter subterraneus subsp. pacificus DSM 12653 TaxID=391606 RepID=B7R5S8_9THEO|nr:radical SAM protein [Caldanaerobacter subterraneus]KKC29889.1 hypothetical protein CDSM653_01118 [Caldanaerobacter subterraneus subsp. pacificus DSM 12653]
MIRVLGLIVTSDCNLRCSYCDYSNKRRDKKSNLLVEDVERFILAMSDYMNLGEIMITGGEPFLLSNIEYWILTMKKYSPNISILTNGTLIDSEQIRWLKKHSVTVHISIDSLNSEYSELYRGGHEKLLSILSKFEKENYKNLKLNITMSRANIEDVHKIICYAKKNMFGYAINLLDLPPQNELSWYNATERERHEAIEIIKKYMPQRNNFYEKLAKSLISKRPIKKIPKCIIPRNYFIIDSDGKVYPCYLYKKSIGTIFDKEYEIINNHKNLVSIKEKNGYECITTRCFSLL